MTDHTDLFNFIAEPRFAYEICNEFAITPGVLSRLMVDLRAEGYVKRLVSGRAGARYVRTSKPYTPPKTKAQANEEKGWTTVQARGERRTFGYIHDRNVTLPKMPEALQ
jgi:hypothetical protein